MIAPFPYFGGKSKAAGVVWEMFGDVYTYVEPFAGSLAVLLGRPDNHDRKIETVNDVDNYTVSFWRANTHKRTIILNTALAASIGMALDVIPTADLYAIHIAAALYGNISPTNPSFQWLLDNHLVDTSGTFKHQEETVTAVTSEINRRR